MQYSSTFQQSFAPLAKRVFALVLTFLTPIQFTARETSQATSSSDLVILNVTVNSKKGDFVTELHRDNFEIIDDKEKATIESFEVSDKPLSIGILIDRSNSTRDINRRAISDAISRFLELSNRQNEYFVMTFDTKPDLLMDWGSDRDLIAQKSNMAPQTRLTALYDALFAALDKLESGHNERRVLLVVTDGLDNSSRRKFAELKEKLRRSDATVYAITISVADEGTRWEEEVSGVMSAISRSVGGQAIFPRDANELNGAIEGLAFELRHRYSLSFRVSHGNQPNQWRRITVKVALGAKAPEEFSGLRARTRQGYYTK
jgi:Ca-activated chloride channel family protein